MPALQKRCCTCRQPKVLDEFFNDKSRVDGKTRRCKLCQKKAATASAQSREAPERKRCPSCGRTKITATSFYADRTRTDGFSVYCKPCQDPDRSDRRQKRRGWRKYQRRARGLTDGQYEAMLRAQGGACAICKQPPSDSRVIEDPVLPIDHDHETGEVRGLLCGPCNRGLGLFRDDPERLRNAARYLERVQVTDAPPRGV